MISFPKGLAFGVVTALLASNVLLGGGACTNELPATSGGGAPVIGKQCDSPQEGCACTEGSVVACGVKTAGDDQFVYCYEGKRTCQNGVLGPCVDGTIIQKSAKTIRMASVGAEPGGLRIQGLGTTAPCTSEDVCDPYCNVITDTATGLTGPGVTISDGGLTVGAPVSTCPNSTVEPTEQCDDGNTTNGDGCDSSCRLEPGWKCPTPGAPCVAAVCGNGIVEGLEQCDDGPWTANPGGRDRPYDGCFNCQREVNCPGTGSADAVPCTAVCGDGLKFPEEECDDGNTTNGDGCSSTCTIETGASCTTSTAAAPAYIDIPAVYRDFNVNCATAASANANPDFQMSCQGSVPHPGGSCNTSAVRKGEAALRIGADGKPAFLSASGGCVRDATSFYSWYHDTNTIQVPQVILGRFLRLARQPSGAYLFDSGADPLWTDSRLVNCNTSTTYQTCSSLSNGGFFPINALGYGNYGTTGRNYHFTSEVRYPFTYTGGESLSFIGDDDVFVYIGGLKVVDIGGIHGALSGSVTLDAATQTDPPTTPPTYLNLVVGRSYEIAVFQAERNTVGSNYRLTLGGFTREVSTCTPPPNPAFYSRDFQATCPPGTRFSWHLFRWQAGVPAGREIAFSVATAEDPSALPATPDGTTSIGTATSTNSSPSTWAFATNPDGSPRPVQQALREDGKTPEAWLRVFMTFNGGAPPALLYQWQQLYDCLPSE